MYLLTSITSEAQYDSEIYLFPYQQYLLILRIPFTDFAKIRFKLDYFPPIINITLYPISALACP